MLAAPAPLGSLCLFSSDLSGALLVSLLDRFRVCAARLPLRPDRRASSRSAALPGSPGAPFRGPAAPSDPHRADRAPMSVSAGTTLGRATAAERDKSILHPTADLAPQVAGERSGSKLLGAPEVPVRPE